MPGSHALRIATVPALITLATFIRGPAISGPSTGDGQPAIDRLSAITGPSTGNERSAITGPSMDDEEPVHSGQSAIGRLSVMDEHPIINEFMASNATTLADEDGDYSDWIELYNPTDQAVDLDGWSLTDRESDPHQWTFPEITLAAEDYLIVFASGKDRKPGSHVWNSVIRQGDGYRYLPGVQPVPDDWNQPDFDDSAWSQGSGSLGYDQDDNGVDIQTTVDAGVISVYARIPFTVSDPDEVLEAVLDIDYDDGFVAYVNGQEIARNLMGSGRPSFDTFASGLHEAVIHQGGTPERYPLTAPEALLQTGRNVLAIQVHNANDTSSDLTLIPFFSLKTVSPSLNHRGTAPEIARLEVREVHTNFRLNRDGEYLALVDPSGQPASAFAPYPEQRPDVSYGPLGEGFAFFDTPTPGTANASGSGASNPTDPPTFSAEHGLYDNPFSLFLFPETPGSVLRYTLDGSQPTANTDMIYAKPIPIHQTTVVRAAAFGGPSERSPTVTRTYVFPRDVIRQSPTGRAPPGWPSTWGSNAVDYGMDPEIVNGREDEIVAALMEVPSFSIAMEIDSLFHPVQGIYSNALEYGRDWERPASIELIYPPGFSHPAPDSGPAVLHGPRSGFQINAGVRIRGGYSRSDHNPKHAFRLFFRSEYGPSKLDYPLFGDEGVDSFDKVDLRTSQNYSWSMQGDPRNTLLRDVFSRDTQRDMGVPYTRSRYYHLYLNGQYWGLFQTQERSDHWHGASYLGGDAFQYDVVKSAGLDGSYAMEITAGRVDAWRTLYERANLLAAAPTEIQRDSLYMRLQGRHPNGTRNPNELVLLDPDNLIQYMLVIFWTGNTDSPITPFNGTNNFFGYRDRTGDRGFAWFAHDNEHTLFPESPFGNYHDRTGPFPAGAQFRFSNPQWIHQQLMGSREYRLRFADLAHRHLTGSGVLTEGPSVKRWNARAVEVEPAIIAESARWGDAKRNEPLTKSDWQREVNRVPERVIPPRTQVILDQLKRTRRYARGNPGEGLINAPLYPAIDAPTFREPGGSVPAGFALGMQTPAIGTIFYTLDGTDPRSIGGDVAGSAMVWDGTPVPLSGHTRVRARVRVDDGGSEATWSALAEVDYLVNVDSPRSAGLVLSEIHYHPGEPDESERRAGVEDPDDFEFIELHNPSTVSVSLAGMSFMDGIVFTFGDQTLGPGERAVVVRDRAAFRLRYGDEPRVAGAFASGGLSNDGERLMLTDRDGQVLARVEYDDAGGWPSRADGRGSSLVLVEGLAGGSFGGEGESFSRPEAWRASIELGGTPGTAGRTEFRDVIVNEVLAHSDPPELDAVELHNTTTAPIDMGGWRLSDGPGPNFFTIPEGTTLEAGEYLTFDENDFNAPDGNGFAFSSSRGDEVWLVATDDTGRPTLFADHVAFGATRTGETVGLPGDAGIDFVPLAEPTLGNPNSAPRVGAVVLREIMYHPPGNNPNLEYLTLLNAGSASERLDSWTLRQGIDFAFPDGLELAPGDSLLVLGFDPDTEPEKAAAFRQAYDFSDAVPLVGGWEGRLANEGETIELNRPDAPPPNEPDFTPETLEERVTYDDDAPWPQAADGQGSSLFRIHVTAFGNDPAYWQAAGRPFIDPVVPPVAPEVPASGYALSPLFPNPTRDRTQSMLTVGTTQQVRITLYDILGRRVHRILDDTVASGTIRQITIDGAGLASGVYLVRVTGGTFSVVQPITFVR